MSLLSTYGPNAEVQKAVQLSSTPTDQSNVDQSSLLGSTAPSLSLFPNAQNFEVKGGQFNAIAGNVTINNNTIDNDPVSTILCPHVAAGAIFDSAARYDAGKCHPGTRTKIIERIVDWINNLDASERILWMNGAAGAGKSALAHTICELLQQSYPSDYGASFFFFGDSPDRGNALKLFATLAYQLAIHFPAIRTEINNVLSLDPSLPTKSMEIQLLRLIVEPLQRSRAHLSHAPILIIDGLDECADDRGRTQAEIVALVAKYVVEHKVPLRFMIASRPEYWIRDAFDTAPLPSITLHISLRDDVDANRDITAYLTDGFGKIYVENKRFMKSVTLPWPPAYIVAQFVKEASGQYIYAATVLKFVGYHSKFSNPQKQLEIITSLSPYRVPAFSQLDRLYTTIISAYPDWETMKRVLAALLLEANMTIIKFVLGVDPDELDLVLDALSSLIEKKKRKPLSGSNLKEEELVKSIFGSLDDQGTMSFCHRSFREFLGDEDRSGPFYIDLGSDPVPETIVRGFFDMIHWNLDQNYETAPHIFLDIDLPTYQYTLWNATFNSTWYCSLGVLLPFITHMTTSLALCHSRTKSYMHSVFYFIREMDQLSDALKALIHDRFLVYHNHEGCSELLPEFQTACQDLQQVIVQAYEGALSGLVSCSNFEATPALVYLTEYQCRYSTLPLDSLPFITGVTDTTLALEKYHYIVPLWYNPDSERWNTYTNYTIFGNKSEPRWRNQGAWRDLRTSFARQSLKLILTGYRRDFGRHHLVFLQAFFNSKTISDIANKEYFQNTSNLGILEAMTDLSALVGLLNLENYIPGPSLSSMICWINRQLTNHQTARLLQEYDDTLEEKLAEVLKYIFEHGFLPHFSRSCQKGLCAFAPGEQGKGDARSTAIKVRPLPHGLYEKEMARPYSAHRSWRDDWHAFHNELFGEMAEKSNPIIHPSRWHPHLIEQLLRVLVRFLYGRVHPEFSEKHDYERSFPYITQCLPYAEPSPENLDALRAIVYLYPQVIPAWNLPDDFWPLTVEFLKKYDCSILSSEELQLFVVWLNSTEHADISTYTSDVHKATASLLQVSLEDANLSGSTSTTASADPSTNIPFDPTLSIQGGLTTLDQPHLDTNTPETHRGSNGRISDVGTDREYSECGLPVDCAQAHPEQFIRYGNLGCDETHGSFCGCCTIG